MNDEEMSLSKVPTFPRK